MPNARLIIFCICALKTSNCSAAGKIVDITEAKGKGWVVKSVRPEYPVEARAAYQTGSGVFILNVDWATGEVTSVTIKERTGHRLLDAAGLKAFIQWRFKPHTVTKIRIPLTYTMTSANMKFVPQSAHPTPFHRPVTPSN